MKEKKDPIMEETTSILKEGEDEVQINDSPEEMVINDSSEGMVINDLPEEMIINVLSFLSFFDKLSARLVCKLWHRLSFSFSLIRNDVTVLKNNFNLVRNPTPHSQHSNIRLIINKKNSMASSVLGNCTRFWQDHCMNVRSVEADVKGNISWHVLELFQHFPAIEHITMDYKCSNLLNLQSRLAITKTTFKNLQSFSVEGFADFVVSFVNIILERAPKLEKIVLRSYRLYSEHTLSKINFKQAQGLKEISLASEDINDELITCLADNVGANLERLLLFNTCNCKFPLSSIDTLTKCVNLKHLLLSHVLWDKPTYLKPFMSLNSLTALSLRYVQNLTDDKFATLVHLDRLSHFEMCCTSELTQRGIAEVFCAKSRPTMIELRMLEFFHIKGYDVVRNMAPNFPNLKVLYAESSDITVATLEALMKYNLSLQCLTLIGNLNTTPSRAGLCNNAMNKLVHMDIRCTHISWSVCQYIKLPVLETFIYNGSGFQKIKNKDSVKLLSSCFYNDNQFVTICSKKEERLLTCCKSPFVRCFIIDM